MRTFFLASMLLLVTGCGIEEAPLPPDSNGKTSRAVTPLHRTGGSSANSYGLQQHYAPQMADLSGSRFGDVMQVFQKAPLPAADKLQPIASSGQAPSVPYGRPDLSMDPDERARAEAMQSAVRENDFGKAQSLATTTALQQMLNVERRTFAEAAQEALMTTQVDWAPRGSEK